MRKPSPEQVQLLCSLEKVPGAGMAMGTGLVCPYSGHKAAGFNRTADSLIDQGVVKGFILSQDPVLVCEYFMVRS
jgi:hypothetical protein